MLLAAAPLPYRLDEGDRLTVLHLLGARRHEVSLVGFVEAPAPRPRCHATCAPDPLGAEQIPTWTEHFRQY